MTRLAAVYPVLPVHSYPQGEISEVLAEVCLPTTERRELLRRLHIGTEVTRRHLAYPLEFYRTLNGFQQANDAFIAAAVELGAEAVGGALKQAGLEPRDVDVILSTTVTGVAVPSLEARVAAKIGMRPDVKRVPMLGLGCMAGAAGVARLHDYVRGDPSSVGVLLSVELCSLTLQRHDPSTANLIASGLFADGAAAVVAVGNDREPPAGVQWIGPTVVDSRSHLFPDTERALGWDIGGTGFKIVLGAEVPGLVEAELGASVDAFLGKHDLGTPDVDIWIAHPGGPRVITAVQTALGLPSEALELSRQSLADFGNLSSASVLHILSDFLARTPAGSGVPAVMMAMGPGFSAELVLLRW